MTIVACWVSHEMEPASLWAVSDSRISRPSAQSSGRTTLIDEGQKIFSLPVICRKPGSGGFFSEIYHTHTVGLAFAGDTLIGLNIASLLTTLLTNLCGHEECHVPSIQDIAQLVSRVAIKYIRSQSSNTGNANYEAAVMGYCHRQDRLRVFHIGYRINENKDGLLPLCDEVQLNDPSYVLLLGTKKTDVYERINKEREGLKITDIQYCRAPKKVIESLVESETHEGIGGNIQLGIATQRGFNPYAVLKPIEKNKPLAALRFVGVDIVEDIGKVGDCQVLMIGMA